MSKRYSRSNPPPAHQSIAPTKTHKKKKGPPQPPKSDIGSGSSQSPNICKLCSQDLSYDPLQKLKMEIEELNRKLKELTQDTEKELLYQETQHATISLMAFADELCRLQTCVNVVKEKPSAPGINNNDNFELSNFVLQHDFLTSDEVGTLISKIESLEFKETTNRDIYYAGEYDYKYSHLKHEAQPIPDFISDIIERLPNNDSSKINTVLINRYPNGLSYIGAHADDEPGIVPWSNILNISLGQARIMRFTSQGSDKHFDHELKSGTLNIMTREMQNRWKHEILPDPKAAGVRYSLTFRHIDPQFSNSTLIASDSRCRDIMFGNSIGTLGSKCPGERINSFTVETLPSADYMASFNNVIIHVGVNNLRKNRDDIKITEPGDICQEIEMKCFEVHKLNPDCKIGISTVIPSADVKLNEKVYHLNKLLYILTLKDPLGRLHLLNFNFMRDFKTGALRDMYRCSKTDDMIHIGEIGVKVIGAIFKKFIRKQDMFRNHSPKWQDGR